MKAIYICSLLLLASFSCTQKPKVAAAATSNDFKKGESFYNTQTDSAYYYFYKVTTEAKNNLLIAQAYCYMGIIQFGEGDYYGSQESLLTSLQYLDEHNDSDQNCLISDYNELGRTSANLKNYATALEYFDKALKLANNDYSKTMALNNKALVYLDEHLYDKAINIYDSILNQSKGDKLEYARVLSNLAKANWLKDSTYKAAPQLLEALNIRESLKDSWGLNASYARLSDYYANSHPDSGLIYAEKMYAVAAQLNSPDDRLEALQKLIRLSPAKEAKAYFADYQGLNDSIQTARITAKNQFALIRYETQKNKAAIITLEQEKSDENNLNIIIVLSGIIIAISALFWYKRRKQQMEWRTRNTIRENQFKTSQKVHDVVANGLYNIMTGLEHREEIEKEQLLNEIEVLYEKSRDISYETSENIDFPAAMSKIRASFATDQTKILVAGSDKVEWDKIRPQTKSHLEAILLELLVNMKKHSSAENVVIQFEPKGKTLKIIYHDDGVGLASDSLQGNGMANTGNRITRMGGRITFDKNFPKGLKVEILIPNA